MVEHAKAAVKQAPKRVAARDGSRRLISSKESGSLSFVWYNQIVDGPSRAKVNPTVAR